jgi:Asp-tRNA(Asn)/Glu-tRNA(Gln) amidotransferase A subunit family amidase
VTTEWDAVETADRIRRGDVTAAEVLDAAIARAEAAVGPRRGGGDVVSSARARGSRGCRRVRSRREPTFVKDLSQLRGVATAWGSPARARSSRAAPIRS